MGEAIEQWNGGVVVISHNLEFCNRVATEKWIMDAGHLRAEGGEYTDTKIDDKGEPDEVFDGAGNKIDVQKQKTLAAKDIKKAIKDGEKKKTLSDEEKWELQDKLAALKEQLGKA